jgi:hypothetical protein
LSCYGVPLFAWGESLFKALAYKYGTFITVDDATKHLMRADVARIKVSTSNEKLIDSSLKIMVLGQKFVIKVLEVTGRAGEGEAVCCGGCRSVEEEATSVASINGGASILATVDGGSREGSDGDPSESFQVLLQLEQQNGGKEVVTSTRLDMCQEECVPVLIPNKLGNSLTCVKNLVNGEEGRMV